MGAELGHLWRGELPLARALIGYALIYGLTINLLMSGVAMVAYMMTSSTVLLLVLHFGALPYNIIACIGAWRSINRFEARPAMANMARFCVAGIFAVLLLV